MNQLKPVASLAAAAIIAIFNTLPTAEAANTAPKCGFTRALRIIESVESVKNHSDTILARSESNFSITNRRWLSAPE